MTETKSATTPKVIGHRGAAGHAPENTLVSLEKAAVLGVRWVEFDTKLSADGVPVVFHDDMLERTTDGHGPIAKRTLMELQALDAGTWFGNDFAGEPVPTLGHAMATLARLGLGANVEIKASPGREAETGRAVGELLKSEWPETLPQPLMSSFDAETLAAAGDAAPEIPRAFLVFKIPRGWLARLQDLGSAALHCQAKHLTKKKAQAVLDGGFQLRVFTVNDAALAEKLFGWGVDAVISDYPDRLVSL